MENSSYIRKKGGDIHTIKASSLGEILLSYVLEKSVLLERTIEMAETPNSPSTME